METPRRTPIEVIESCRAGDQGAFAEIVRLHQRRVYNLAYRMLGHAEEAKDLSQEVFISVYGAIRGLREERKFEAWLTQITLNHCRNRLKVLKRRHYYNTESIDDPVETEDGTMERPIVSPGDDPETLCERKMIQEFVQRGLLELREDQRELIVLRDLQGYSYEMVSEVCGLPIGTVKSKLHRARMDLKAILERAAH
jgi:RNA polymerase sigma-70 factor, ECF subfamily